MLSKEKLIEKIKDLPLFEFKDIFIEKNDLDREFDRQERFRAITEIDKSQALSIVSNRYKLIQFKDILLPIIESLNDLEGITRIYDGEGYTLIFPKKEEENKEKFGLIIFNSVTKKYAVIIDFIILIGGRHYLILPRKVKKFKNRHIGNIKEIVEDYEKILSEVKEEWELISDKFNRTINQKEYNFILDELKLGKKINKKLTDIYEDEENKEIILWDFLLEVIKNIQEKEYKNEVNKMKKIKFISEVIFKFAVIENLK